VSALQDHRHEHVLRRFGVACPWIDIARLKISRYRRSSSSTAEGPPARIREQVHVLAGWPGPVLSPDDAYCRAVAFEEKSFDRPVEFHC
jgi:hypothetical protein